MGETAKKCRKCGVLWILDWDADWCPVPALGEPFCRYVENKDCVFTPDTVADMVAEFHQAFGDGPHKLGLPGEVMGRTRKLRWALLAEEFDEYDQAEYDNDIVEIADALADMVYVIYGTAYTYGIDLDAVLREVHRSNMTKDFTTKEGKIKKGPGYERPDIAGVLGL